MVDAHSRQAGKVLKQAMKSILYTHYTYCYDVLMKKITMPCILLLISCLAMTLLKPIMSPETVQHAQTYASTQTECSGRSTVVTPCQSSACYVLAEEQISLVTGFLFVVTSILSYVLATLVTSSPVFRIFRPPLCSRFI